MKLLSRDTEKPPAAGSFSRPQKFGVGELPTMMMIDDDDGREAAVLPFSEAAAMRVDCRVDVELSFSWCYGDGGRRAGAVADVAAWAD